MIFWPRRKNDVSSPYDIFANPLIYRKENKRKES
jgi:hypothetical protein